MTKIVSRLLCELKIDLFGEPGRGQLAITAPTQMAGFRVP